MANREPSMFERAMRGTLPTQGERRAAQEDARQKAEARAKKTKKAPTKKAKRKKGAAQ